MAISDVEYCDLCQVHENMVRTVNDEMPDRDKLYDLAEIFKVFGDSTRIEILYMLFEAEMCVFDITQLLNMNQSAISHQLKTLKRSRLVKNHRGGKTVSYSLTDNHVRTIINQGMEHMKEQTLRQTPMARGWDMEYK